MYVLYRRIGTARTWFPVLLSILLVTMFDFGPLVGKIVCGTERLDHLKYLASHDKATRYT